MRWERDRRPLMEVGTVHLVKIDIFCVQKKKIVSSLEDWKLVTRPGQKEVQAAKSMARANKDKFMSLHDANCLDLPENVVGHQVSIQIHGINGGSVSVRLNKL